MNDVETMFNLLSMLLGKWRWRNYVDWLCL